MDNHYAYDGSHSGQGPSQTYIDKYGEHAEKLGLPYHWWAQTLNDEHFELHPHHRQLQPGPSGGIHQIYAVDPTGFAV